MISIQRSFVLAAPLLAAALALPALRAQNMPGPQDAFAPERPTVLVLVDRGGDALGQALSAQASQSLVRALNDGDYIVVDEELAQRRARRNSAILKSWTGKDISPDQQLARLSYADVFVRVSFKAGRERKRQGRYSVADQLEISMASTDDARNLMQESLRATGLSMDGYREAHEQALEQVCGAQGRSLAGLVLERLELLHKEELARGSLYTVVFYVEGEYASQTAAFAEKLGSISQIDAESITTGNSGTIASDGRPPRAYTEFRLRYKGRSSQMRAELHRVIQELRTSEDEAQGTVLDPAFISTRRRIDILLRRRIPEATLDKEIERQLTLLVEEIYSKHSGYLAGRRLSIAPADLPKSYRLKADLDTFASAYWRTLDQIEKLLAREEGVADPMAYGPVEVLGTEFATLAEARNRADELSRQYYGSAAGKMAVGISDLLRGAIAKVSEGNANVLVGRDEQAQALDLIKYEADLYREEGAVAPETIAFFERDGAQAMVTSSLDTLLDSYELRIVVIDLDEGATIRQHCFLPARFKQDLDRILKS